MTAVTAVTAAPMRYSAAIQVVTAAMAVAVGMAA